MATNYDINYNDSRFKEVEADKKAALSEVEKTYGGMISQSDKYYQKQIDAAQDYADKQTQLQNQQTDFAIKEINQQKAQAKKDYTKEQSGAYVDWQKQSNEYGANAEAMAAQGMTNTGYSESSQVSMYNTYQNRVATAREAYVLAVQNYDNSITQARLQNSSVLAEIAYNALKQQLELSLQGFQYKNQLILDKANKKTQLDSEYYSRYQDVLKQINTENALAEEVRQYNEKMAEEKRQYNATLSLQKAQLAEEKRQFDAQMAYQKSKSSGGSGGSGGSKSSGGSGKVRKSSGGGHAKAKAPTTKNSGHAQSKAPTTKNGSSKITYKQAVSNMTSSGVSSATASGLMTESEWNRRKKSFQRTGIGNAAVKNYGTYARYVADYTEYAKGK
jgi:uncharacterized membrane protein YgcG